MKEYYEESKALKKWWSKHMFCALRQYKYHIVAILHTHTFFLCAVCNLYVLAFSFRKRFARYIIMCMRKRMNIEQWNDHHKTKTVSTLWSYFHYKTFSLWLFRLSFQILFYVVAVVFSHSFFFFYVRMFVLQ